MDPWMETDVWKNESQYLVWLRGGLRKALWSRYPVRIQYKNNRCMDVTDALRAKYELSGRVKKAGKCEICHNMFPKSKLEVDHMQPCGALRMDNIGEWIGRLLCSHEHMQLLCKECHGIVTYSERMNITFEEASVEKQVIAFSKLSVEKQKSILGSLPRNNAQTRKVSYRDMLTLR